MEDRQSVPITVVGEDVGPRANGFLNHTTFHIRNHFGNARIVAAFYNDGKLADGNVQFFVQFAYCSPKERTTDKYRGQMIATYRLMNTGERGGIPFSLPENFTGKMLRDAIKCVLLAEIQRKNIQWLKKLEVKTTDDLV